MVWLKIPVLDATITDGDGPNSSKIKLGFGCSKNDWKYPQVSSKISNGVPSPS